VEPSAVVQSNSVTISGIQVAVPVTVSGGDYSVGCTGTFTSAAGSIGNNETVCVRHTASSSVSTSTTTTLTVGGVSGTFQSTTRAAPPASGGGGGATGAVELFLGLAALAAARRRRRLNGAGVAVKRAA
jgi:hypothetical protein